jgi:hypothetical protein
MAKIGEKIKEVVGGVDNISKFQKFNKRKASYIEYDKFADSNLHEGYFCYNCIYWISMSGGKMSLHRMDVVQDMRLITTSYMIQEGLMKLRISILKRTKKK